MSGFEFVLVLYAIISGLGISDILSGWGEQVRARRHFSPYPLQMALSFLLMYYGISILWSFWTFRDLNWTFSLYIAFAIIPLVISPGKLSVGDCVAFAGAVSARTSAK